MNYYITSKEHAEIIIKAFNQCKGCGDCVLDNLTFTEGYCCGYLYNKAVAWLQRNRKISKEGENYECF